MPAPGPQRVAEALSAGNAGSLAASLSNNLTAASAVLVPEVLDALAWLGGQPGVLGAAMAGSGSATFAICKDASAAARAAQGARALGWWAAATATRPGGVKIIDEDQGLA
jgi:4-diphosphocytidyl-2C-methyl-D-erythritol kinase